MLGELYNEEFYARQVDGSARSARVILPILYKLYQPSSVVDIGCGRGGWLATAEALGSTRLKGLDGPWVSSEQLLSRRIEFTPIAFDEAIEINERYDLCISVEVAEHLPETRAEAFINTLCSCSDVVLFSAAVKEQGGTNHINEQWQSYWIQLFKDHRYDCLDILRPAIWSNEDVEWWYRQNIFLFVRDTSPLAGNRTATSAPPIADIVHPVNYEKKTTRMKQYQQTIQYPTFRFCLRCFKRFLTLKLESLRSSR